MSTIYLKEIRPLDSNGNEIVPDYEKYNLRFIGYFDMNIQTREYISVVEGSEEDVDSLISDYEFVSRCPDSRILENFKKEKLDLLESYHTEFIFSRYPLTRQISFIVLSMIYGQSKPQIMMAVMQVFSWIFQYVMPYYYQITNQIKVAETLEQLNSITWDYSQFDQYDPKLTVEQLIRIISG